MALKELVCHQSRRYIYSIVCCTEKPYSTLGYRFSCRPRLVHRIRTSCPTLASTIIALLLKHLPLVVVSLWAYIPSCDLFHTPLKARELCDSVRHTRSPRCIAYSAPVRMDDVGHTAQVPVASLGTRFKYLTPILPGIDCALQRSTFSILMIEKP